jgi:hypothetical protein
MPITSAPARAAVRTVQLRRRHRRLLFIGLLLFLTVSTAAVFLTSASQHPVHAAPTRYGTDPARMQAAVQAAVWPQKNGIWCGIADIAAIADYRDPANPIDQNAVVNYLNSAPAQSAWGTPDHNWNIAWGPGFLADISRDGGTDPRSMAAGLTTLAHGSYHQLVDYHSASNATAHLISDLVRTQEPITVFVNAGSHSVLVSAVFAYGDPTNLNNVTSLEVYDSGAGTGVGVQPNQVSLVPLSGWLWWWAYYGATYHENIYDGRHALDPDPSVGPYTYDPSQGRNVHLWVGHYVYIHPDSASEAAHGVSPDWAFNQDGALIRGLHGEVPPDYSGPSTAMYIPPLPPPPPPPTPTPTNTPIPTHTPHPRLDPTEPGDEPTPVVSPAPTPTAGSLFGFSLRTICLGSSCAGADTISAVMLGGASSLSATVLLLVGVLMARRRRRKATRDRAIDAGREASEDTATAGATPRGVATQSVDDTAAVEELPAETGPLARLAEASERLAQLAEGTETAETPGIVPADPATPPTASLPDTESAALDSTAQVGDIAPAPSATAAAPYDVVSEPDPHRP